MPESKVHIINRADKYAERFLKQHKSAMDEGEARKPAPPSPMPTDPYQRAVLRSADLRRLRDLRKRTE